MASACSYVAPIRTIQLENGTVVDYELFLTIGTLEKIRARLKTTPQNYPMSFHRAREPSSAVRGGAMRGFHRILLKIGLAQSGSLRYSVPSDLRW